MIYFIRAAGTEAVKIGFAFDVEHRIAELQCGNHLDLVVLRIIDGDRIAEKWLHRHFASRQLRREWFAFDEAMLSIKLPAIPRRQSAARDSGSLTFLRDIEDRRMALGLRRLEFCRLAGIVPTTMTRWLNGHTEPNMAVYRRIVNVLEVAEAARRAAGFVKAAE